MFEVSIFAVVSVLFWGNKLAKPALLLFFCAFVVFAVLVCFVAPLVAVVLLVFWASVFVSIFSKPVDFVADDVDVLDVCVLLLYLLLDALITIKFFE
ncbi:MAG: hypothetical protein RL154_1677 [Pseudomonadota bacterium]